MAARRIKSLFGVLGQRAHREHRAGKNRTPDLKYRKETRRMKLERLEKILKRETKTQ